MRHNNRLNNQLREVELIPNYNAFAEGSCLVKFGNTHVLCTASVEEKLPSWLKGHNCGWITAEYGMLPRANRERSPREPKQVSGRSHEIQRLIGRSLRAAVDLTEIKDYSIYVDCDVLQADGGTRTASITGGFVAMYLALENMIERKIIKKNPVIEFIAAVSCDILHGEKVIDVDYAEDSHAQVDMNFVMTESGKIVEVQGAAEGAPFEENDFIELLTLARSGIKDLIKKQKEVLGVE
ncbi:MAG: ribonuclease PH [Alphaproteobacteria bacterium]|nr:ribonuclease PH [Alphaproteobacteria bacterium]